MPENKNRKIPGSTALSKIKRDRQQKEDNNSRQVPFIISIFSRFHYDIYDYQVEPEENTATEFTKNGMPYRFKPQMIKDWQCEYFTTPYGKARLLRHAALSMLGVMLIALSSLVDTSIYVYLSTFLFIILFINFIFRYFNIALWKMPMPEIPYFSNLFRETEHYEFSTMEREIYRMNGDDIDIDVPGYFTGEEEDDKSNDENEDDVTYVEVVNRENNGNKSPGTILSEYMNNTVKWNSENLFVETKGVINEDILQSLLDDDEDTWSNFKYLKALEVATSARPDRWMEQMDKWKNG